MKSKLIDDGKTRKMVRSNLYHVMFKSSNMSILFRWPAR